MIGTRSRQRRGAGYDNGTWPVLLLLLAAVLAPTACMLWFMNEAVRNERLAVRQKLTEVYRGQLVRVRDELEQQLAKTAETLEAAQKGASAPQAFAAAVSSRLADSLVFFDEQGQLSYPAPPQHAATEPAEDAAAWAAADDLENLQAKPAQAAKTYADIAARSSDINEAARALVANVRCLVRAGQADAAIEVLAGTLEQDKYRHAVDAQGRLIVADAELRVIEIMQTVKRADKNLSEAFERLDKRLRDYSDPLLPASQRLFLMKQMLPFTSHSSSPARSPHFPTLEAEELAARFLESHPSVANVNGMRASFLADVWQMWSANGRFIALYRTVSLQSRMGEVLARQSLPADVGVRLLTPKEQSSSDTTLVSLAAGPHWPDWRLTLSLSDRGLFDSAAERQVASYLWTGVLVIAAMSILAVVAARMIGRQARLARLKNDLVATVSHELKTPLSAMRLLVDTLLDGKAHDEHCVRDYLQLIARENTRLSRLIDNFLTFSRMQRGRRMFSFAQVRPEEIVRGAVEVVGDRFNTPACRFDVETEPNLPMLHADADALVTVLINLLENANKYSGAKKHIILRTYAADGELCFEVTDNGIGLSPRACRKVFKPFYQADQRLSRSAGGCGLGLSIVQYIVAAHGGSVRVNSQPDRGSIFTVTLKANASGGK